MPSQEAALATMVDELRGVGVGVSVGEHLDAARALASIPLADIEGVRSALQCALIKRAEHLDAFNVLFNLHFVGTRPSDPGPFADLTDAELAAALRAAIASADAAVLRQLADEYVRRFAALQPGAPVAGVFAMIAASEAADLDGIRAELLAAMAGQRGGGPGGGGDGDAGDDLAAAGTPVPGPRPSPSGSSAPRQTGRCSGSAMSCRHRSAGRLSPIGAPARSARPCGSGWPRMWTSQLRRLPSGRLWSPRSGR
jgi:hypothetical protein